MNNKVVSKYTKLLIEDHKEFEKFAKQTGIWEKDNNGKWKRTKESRG
jgi:hypothetical protein